MGLTRQAVQRLANEMERDGLVRFAPNPHHQRAKLVLLTPRGKSAYDAAIKRQGPWASSLANGLSIKQINAAKATLRAIRQRLEDRAGRGDSDA
jgi:DNA-binding MarR family transcriptional regulator